MNFEKTTEKMADKIYRKLTQAFTPTALEIQDESAKHAGHAGHRDGGESHFNVKIVSNAFKGQSKVARHRAVYAVLDDEMKGPIHALALDLSAPGE